LEITDAQNQVFRDRKRPKPVTDAAYMAIF
jgi:hypothetical protein